MPALVAPRERLLCAVVDAREGLDPVALAEQACEALDGEGGRLRAAASRLGVRWARSATASTRRAARSRPRRSPTASSRRVASYRDLGAFQLILSLQDDEALRLYCDSVLGPLEGASGEYGDELIRSLETYIEQNGQWERAARELYCHRHTLRYRIRRVEQLTGRDLSNGPRPDRVLARAEGARAGESMREGSRDAMKVGVPTEIKTDEYRVSLTPAGVRELTERGHDVLVQSGAGEGSTIADSEYEAQGARDPPDAQAVFDEAELVLGVKEPQAAGGVDCCARAHAVHLPAPGPRPRAHARASAPAAPPASRTRRWWTRRAGCRCSRRCRRWRARSPPRRARSSSRSRWAAAACCSAACPGVAAATVLVIGGGVVGQNAAFIAIGMEADVFVFDRNLDRLRELDVAFGGRASTVYSSTLAIEEMLPLADLVIGAVLVHGARAPYVIKRDQLALMKKQAVLVDVSIDQGGCFETSQAHHALRSRVRGGRRDPLLRDQHARRGARHLARSRSPTRPCRTCSRSPTTAWRGDRQGPGPRPGRERGRRPRDPPRGGRRRG